MEYRRIVAVTGLPGLFEIVSSKTDGAIVRSLEDKSTKFVSSRVHNLSHLESIEVYTVRDNVNLVEILNAMQASKEKLPDGKDNKVLKALRKARSIVLYPAAGDHLSFYILLLSEVGLHSPKTLQPVVGYILSLQPPRSFYLR